MMARRLVNVVVTQQTIVGQVASFSFLHMINGVYMVKFVTTVLLQAECMLRGRLKGADQ